MDDECRVYAFTWEKSPDGKRRMFDVFDEQGRYIARIPLPSRSLFIKKGKLYSVEEDEEGYQHLKRYKSDLENQVLSSEAPVYLSETRDR